MAKSALLSIGMEWASRGQGSLEQGLVPRNQVKPFTAGDELELIDIEATLDSLINEGKSIEQIEPDNLYAYQTEKGRATVLILIDISGSMSGENLAICALAAVMLLNQLQSNEVAIAFFESDTHAVKSFSDEIELDKIADNILDLQADGGTCLDTALRWTINEFQEQVSVDHKLFFLLTDFGFFESDAELKPMLQELADLQIRYLGASHTRYIDKEKEQLFHQELGGETVKLTRFKNLPDLLTEALTNLGG